MERGERQNGGPDQAGGEREPQRTQRPAPGKVTSTSRLSPSRGPTVQRKAAAPTPGSAAPAQSRRDFTTDPWMDAAHRGLTALSERGGSAVQMQEDSGAGESGRSPGAGDPVAEIEARIAEAERLLSGGEVPVEKQAPLRAALQRARAELSRLRELQSQGQGRAETLAGMGVAAGALVADDATVVGVADDWLLIVLGLAALGTLLTTKAPASREDIEQAQRSLGRALEGLRDIVGPLMMAKAGDQVRGLTNQVAIHLARMLGDTVAGKPPDHQQDPERDRGHWWKEIKAFLQKIKDQGLSPKQLARELQKKFTEAEIQQIRDALQKAAEMMGESPPFMF